MDAASSDAKIPRDLADALAGLNEHELDVVLERYAAGLLAGPLKQCQPLTEAERAQFERLMEDRFGIGRR